MIAMRLLGVGLDVVEREVPGVDEGLDVVGPLVDELAASRTMWSGIVPGKSALLKSTCEPGRSSAVSVNGANTPTQSNSPPAKPAAASSVSTPRKSMSSSVMPTDSRPCRSRKWSTTPASAAIGLAGQVLDRGAHRLVADDGVVAGGVVVDDDDHLLAAGGDAEHRVVEGLGVAVELAGGHGVERADVVGEEPQVDVEADSSKMPASSATASGNQPGQARVAEGERSRRSPRRCRRAVGRRGRRSASASSSSSSPQAAVSEQERGGAGERGAAGRRRHAATVRSAPFRSNVHRNSSAVNSDLTAILTTARRRYRRARGPTPTTPPRRRGRPRAGRTRRGRDPREGIVAAASALFASRRHRGRHHGPDRRGGRACSSRRSTTGSGPSPRSSARSSSG